MLSNENITVMQLSPCGLEKFAIFRGDENSGPSYIAPVDMWALLKIYEKNVGTYTDVTGVVMSRNEKTFCCLNNQFLSYADSYEQACELLNDYEDMQETLVIPVCNLNSNL
jgi:hypothetical protein